MTTQDVTTQGPGRPVKFTQYVRPHGRPTPITITRPTEIADMAEEVAATGAVFEAEVLMTGEVSLTVECRHDECEDTYVLAWEIVPNGPGVLAAVDRLVRTAHGNPHLRDPSVVGDEEGTDEE